MGFNPSSSLPRIAIKAQAMGEMVSASRLLITACLQSWKPELKVLGNPNLNTPRPDPVLFCPQSRNLPWFFGRTLQPCCADRNGCSAGSILRMQTLCTPARVSATAAAGDASWKSCSTRDLLSSPFCGHLRNLTAALR